MLLLAPGWTHLGPLVGKMSRLHRMLQAWDGPSESQIEATGHGSRYDLTSEEILGEEAP